MGLTVALNAANEIAVALFLEERIGFTQIPELSLRVLDGWDEAEAPASIDDVLGMDVKARALARELARKL